LCGGWKATRLRRAIPVIVVSTDSSLGRVRQLMALGARGYVRDEVERVLGMPYV
jgi:DNA-binding NarL/FixJ family response regulator